MSRLYTTTDWDGLTRLKIWIRVWTSMLYHFLLSEVNHKFLLLNVVFICLSFIVSFFNWLSYILHDILQLTRTKKGEENVPYLYELEGNETLGSYLQIQPCSDNAQDVSNCSIQWYRVSSDGAKKELISGIDFCMMKTCRRQHFLLSLRVISFLFLIMQLCLSQELPNQFMLPNLLTSDAYCK